MSSRQIQKMTAMGLMALGAVFGLWFASGRMTSLHAQEGASTNNLPAAAPTQDLPPPDAGMIPPDLPPPSGGELPQPQGGVVPPEAPPSAGGGAPLPPPAEGGIQLQVPEELSFKASNSEGFIYNPEGRDPFMAPKKNKSEIVQPPPELKASSEIEYNPDDPLQANPLAEYRLVGIIWNVKEPKAMVQTSAGSVYVIRRKVRLGREGAVVAAIRESEIVVVEPNPDGTYVNASTRIIPMRK